MSAIKQLKIELGHHPPVSGTPTPPMLSAWGTNIPVGLIQVIVELIERVEALEADR